MKNRKIAIVTGASRLKGIGAAICPSLLKRERISSLLTTGRMMLSSLMNLIIKRLKFLSYSLEKLECVLQK